MKHSLIDTHCHIDLYDDPLEVAQSAENAAIRTVAVTYLPSHYVLAKQHLRQFKYVKAAIGLHPLVSGQHGGELPLFCALAQEADFIGEIGLDFSREGRETRTVQEQSFATVLNSIRDRKRFVTLHSRGAEVAVLEQLSAANMYPVVFHWFSGTRAQMFKVIDAGHSISINTKMICTQRWIEAVSSIPKDRILTETDGPFVRTPRAHAIPADVEIVVQWLAQVWSVKPEAGREQVARNFAALVANSSPWQIPSDL